MSIIYGSLFYNFNLILHYGKSTAAVRGEGIDGVLTFSQATESSPTIIQGTVTGLTPGKHAIAIHVLNVSRVPASIGQHFNPSGKNHGAPEDSERHVGSLGNIEANESGKADIHIEDKIVNLIGPQSVIGRSIAIAEGEDDMGRAYELSLVNGNAGEAIAAGVISICM